MRLQVFLSHNGVCSRRKAFELVSNGAVTVNGRVVKEPSTPIDAKVDKICVENKLIVDKSYEYIVLNKPKGYMTTRSDRFASKIVYQLIPKQFAHLVPVGRLDKDTEGLLFMTNDGDVVYKLTHPKFLIDKMYFVMLKGCLEGKDHKKLEKGIFLNGRRTAPARIKNIKIFKEGTQLTMTIHEGQKRQIRKMFAKLGYKVVLLRRKMHGPLSIGVLKTGKWRKLSVKEVKAVRGLVDDNN